MLLISDIKKLKNWNIICTDDILKSVDLDSSSDDDMSTNDSSSSNSGSHASSDSEMDTDWIRISIINFITLKIFYNYC